MAERVLIVDDNPQNLKLVRIVLSEGGYDIRTSIDAEEALRVISEFRPNLVLMDLQLPGMDGLELTRRLRADPEHAHVLVIALTAYAMKGDEEKAMAAGCDAYVTKPIDTVKLPIAVAELLARGPRPA